MLRACLSVAVLALVATACSSKAAPAPAAMPSNQPPPPETAPVEAAPVDPMVGSWVSPYDRDPRTLTLTADGRYQGSQTPNGPDAPACSATGTYQIVDGGDGGRILRVTFVDNQCNADYNGRVADDRIVVTDADHMTLIDTEYEEPQDWQRAP